jgi:hypothetical protein
LLPAVHVGIRPGPLGASCAPTSAGKKQNSAKRLMRGLK